MAQENPEITPDMTPEEIEAMSNPGVTPNPGEGDVPQDTPPRDESSSYESDPAMNGRLTASEARATEAAKRADLLEQNNRFLETRAADAAAAAAAAKEEALKHQKEAANLREQIELATVPKVSPERLKELEELHGEASAKHLVDLENRMLASEHRHKIEIKKLQESSATMPTMVTDELKKLQGTARATQFNQTLMDDATGVPDIAAITKDPKFVAFLRADPYGRLNAFDTALQSNDPGAVPYLRKLVDEFRGVPPAGVDSGSGGGGYGSRPGYSGNSGAGNREAAVTEWNRLLDTGDVQKAQTYAVKHKLIDE